MVGFVLMAAAVSLSGVMAPGPITAATLAAGVRNRHAGLMIALGHIAIEFPSILLLVVGLGVCLETPGVRVGIGLAGGGFLLLMGIQLLLSLRKPVDASEPAAQRRPFWTGAILTAASPYFWVWGATVGLTLTHQALELGLLTLVLFALVHWLCDLGWTEVLSLASFKGAETFGPRSQQVVAALSAVMLLGFGVKFLYDAGAGWAAALAAAV